MMVFPLSFIYVVPCQPQISVISDFLLFQQRVRSASWITSCTSTGIYLPFYSQFLEWKTAEGRKRFYEEAGCWCWSTSFATFFWIFANCSVAFLRQKLLIPFIFSVTTEKFICPFCFSRLEDMYDISSSTNYMTSVLFAALKSFTEGPPFTLQRLCEVKSCLLNLNIFLSIFHSFSPFFQEFFLSITTSAHLQKESVR